MSAYYYFQDFKRFAHLEEFLCERIQRMVDHFIPEGKYKLTTRIQTTRARGDLKRPKFLCEVRLDAPQSTVPVVVKKKSSDFYDAALQVSNVLRKVLRRQSSFRAQHHRREHQLVVKQSRRKYNQKAALDVVINQKNRSN